MLNHSYRIIWVFTANKIIARDNWTGIFKLLNCQIIPRQRPALVLVMFVCQYISVCTLFEEWATDLEDLTCLLLTITKLLYDKIHGLHVATNSYQYLSICQQQFPPTWQLQWQWYSRFRGSNTSGNSPTALILSPHKILNQTSHSYSVNYWIFLNLVDSHSSIMSLTFLLTLHKAQL